MARLLRLLKADIHGVLDTFEDKTLLLSQYCREMEDSLQEKEMQIARLAERCHSIEAELATRDKEIGKLEDDLRSALQREKESIARLLIRKQVLQRNYSKRLRRQCDTNLEEQARLSNLADEQRLRYDIIRVKVENFSQLHRQAAADCFDSSRSIRFEIDSIQEKEIDLELIRRKEQLNTGVAT